MKKILMILLATTTITLSSTVAYANTPTNVSLAGSSTVTVTGMLKI